MAGSSGQLFVRNWAIKLAAIFLAIMLYVAVAAQQPLTQSFAMRLVLQVPPGRSVKLQPAGVAVVITGKGSEIPKGTDVQVADITPRDIDIVLDSVGTKEVKIAPRVRIEADSGYVLRGFSIVPSLARIVGPVK